MSRLEELRLAAGAATPGPWWATEDLDPYDEESAVGVARGEQSGDDFGMLVVTPGGGSFDIGIGLERRAANASFIAQANPETVLALVALVKELSAALGLLLERVEPYGIGTADLGPCFAYKFARDRASAALASAATWMEE